MSDQKPSPEAAAGRRGKAILAAFFLVFALLVALIARVYVGNLELVSLLDAEQLSFERNITEQSASFNRVVFSVTDLLMLPLPGDSGFGFPKTLESAQAMVNHARIPQLLEPAFLAAILGDDPLFLAERAAKSNERYSRQLVELTQSLGSTRELGDTKAGREELGEFLAAARGFKDELKDRSMLFVQIEGAYHSTNRKNLERLGARLKVNLIEFSIITVLLLAVSIYYFKTRLSVERELNAHREHLSELVSERTQELGAANALLRSALDEREILIKEVHHRVKNSLSLVASLISLQESEADPENLEESFAKLGQRINAISLIHDKLSRSEDLVKISFRDYIADLCDTLLQSLAGGPSAISFQLDSCDARFSAKTLLPLGLIITELVMNSLKYAFKDRPRGLIRIALGETAQTYFLEVADDGQPPSDAKAILESSSLGMRLVMSLTSQVGGQLELDLSGGTRITIRFPHCRGEE